jgi:hypothetical protein
VAILNVGRRTDFARSETLLLPGRGGAASALPAHPTAVGAIGVLLEERLVAADFPRQAGEDRPREDRVGIREALRC